MSTAIELTEYLNELRQQVCSRCVERPPGGPPCAPLGKFCGVEMHLAKLVDSIHQVRSPLIDPYLAHNREQICEVCPFLRTGICPCPMDYLSVLIVQAVETVDQRHDATDEGRRLSPREGGLTHAEEVRQAYQEASGTWTGCDWPTKFGRSGLDLNGRTAAEVRALAGGAEAREAADWSAAADWLAEVERHARQAETHAAAAVTAAQAGDWREALQHAQQAWAQEFATGRPIWRGFPLTWQRLYQAVEAAFPPSRGTGN